MNEKVPEILTRQKKNIVIIDHALLLMLYMK